MEYVYDRETGKRIQVPASVAASMTRSERYSYTKPNYNYDGAAAEAFGDKWAGPSGQGPAGELDFVTEESLQRDYGDYYDREDWEYRPPTEYNTKPIAGLTSAEWYEANRLWNIITDPDKDKVGGWWTIGEDGIPFRNQSGFNAIEGMEGVSDKIIGELTRRYAVYEWENPIDSGDDFDVPLGGGGRGGWGGSARVDQAYLAPDRRAIEDMVKAQLITYVGTATDKRVQQMTDLYLRDHKAQWMGQRAAMKGTGGEDVDPVTSVMVAIRDTDEYKKIHKLRPEGADEARWIAERRDALRQRGVSQGDADERAVILAQVAANPLTMDAGKFQAGTGSEDKGGLTKIKDAAAMMARLI